MVWSDDYKTQFIFCCWCKMKEASVCGSGNGKRVDATTKVNIWTERKVPSSSERSPPKPFPLSFFVLSTSVFKHNFTRFTWLLFIVIITTLLHYATTFVTWYLLQNIPPSLSISCLWLWWHGRKWERLNLLRIIWL